MMVNRTLIISALFFSLVPWCLGLGNAPQKPEQDIHVSEEVKIEDQEKKDQEKQEAKTPAADKQEKQDKQPMAGDTEKEKAGEKARAEADRKTKAEEEPEEEMMLNEEEALIQGEAQFYSRKDRVDPFEPFLHEEESESQQGEQSGEELDRRKPQTPLEKIALSQLRLTAIIQIPGKGEAIAMVEDQAGKGYTVKEGTYIGENGGQVVDILDDRLIIKEKYKDVFNKIAVREIEKKLQK
ncbi:MAG: pilus assembly protein PilP [Desulfobacterales bacterium]|nr:pilus assembly protein PilP [Desulfobacterales bacterium]